MTVFLLSCLIVEVEEVTLRLKISQSSCLGVEPTLGLANRYYFLSECFCLKVVALFLWGILSNERTGLQFVVQSLNGSSRAEPVTILYCLIWDSPKLEGQVPIFISPRNRVVQFKVKSQVTLWPTVSQSWCLVHASLDGLHLNEFQSDIRRGTLRQNCLSPLEGLHVKHVILN
jgi:hypothetical protein